MNRFYSCGWLLVPIVGLVAPASADEYLSQSEAQKVLFPDADQFVDRKFALTDEQFSKIKELSGIRQRSKLPLVWSAVKKGKRIGWYIVDEAVGKHEFFTFAVAVSMDGHVLGVEILTYKETHGSQIREALWRKNLAGKTINDSFKLDEGVPNISEATLSCRNLADGVKRLLAFQKAVLTQDGL